MTEDVESFEEWRERTAPPEPLPWTLDQHLRCAAGLFAIAGLAYAVGGFSDADLPLFIGVLVLAHGLLRAWAAPDRVERLYGFVWLAVGATWLLVKYRLDDLDASDWIGLAIGLVLLGAIKLWVWRGTRRAART